MATAVSPSQQQQESLSPQQLMQIASMDNAIRETDPQVLRIAAQLSWLASQHHSSEYNQLKFGGRGSPAMYIPLSIQLPFHVKELRVYQQMSAQQQAWWHSSRPVVGSTAAPRFMGRGAAPLIHAGSQSNEHTSDELQEALSLAISSPLTPPSIQPHVPSRDPIGAAPKTSESHPINMSPMVPFELLLQLSIYLQEPTESSPPTYLQLPYELTLDALTTPEYFPAPSVPPPPNPTADMREASAIPPGVLQAGMLADVPTPPPAPHRSPKMSVETIDPSMIPLPASPEDERRAFAPNFCQDFSSENTTPAPQGTQTPSYFSQHLSSKLSEDMLEATSTTMHVPSIAIHLQRPSAPEPVSPPASYINGLKGASDEMPMNDPRCTFNQAPLFSARLGNLLLSSCPGKKVRLHGPVKGRGTIFRNLACDLERIRDSGVGCIVCCLDDSELHFLGVPWEDYAREADRIGLDILRLPTPEGFAPLDVAVLNDHLNALIQQYTLRGISVLVHCRGGVGRAGLIACCWMLKMGLCGWIQKIERLPSQDALNVFFNNHLEVSPDTTSEPSDPLSNGTAIPTPTRPTHYINGITDSPQNHSPLVNYRHALERIETVDLVERAIRVVRRRRSVKAIETFEQVDFLVQFVEFLRRMDSSR